MQDSPENPQNQRRGALEALTPDGPLTPVRLWHCARLCGEKRARRFTRRLKCRATLELHRWRCAGAGLGLEVIIVPVEAQHAREHVVRE